MDELRIYIVGAGALGLMYAARLAGSGVPVTLLTRTKEQAEIIDERGVALEDEGGATEIRLETQVFGEPDAVGQRKTAAKQDWIWLTVKQTHINAGFGEKLKLLAADGAAVMALQNGVGHLDALRQAMPENRLYAAVSTDGALRTSERSVRLTGRGTLAFGPWPKGSPEGGEEQKMLLQKLEAAGIVPFLSNEMGNQVYRKLLINAVINPLTAIFGVPNGKLPDDPVRLALMKSLHIESERILADAGMEPDGRSWERLLDVCRQTSENESSMLRDVKAGRETEIGWINGGLSRLARQRGLPSPLNDALTEIVKALL